MPDLPDNPDSQTLYRAYSEGFDGSIRDPNHLAQFLGENPHPLFGAACTTQGASGEITSLEGSGSGKVVLLYKSLDKFDPTCWTDERQTTGDCVSQAVRKAVDGTRAVGIDILGEAENFLARGATEPIYGCRGHKGQGMSCSVAAKWVSSKGGYLLRIDYPELGLDLSKYNAKIGTNWGRRGVPGIIQEKAQEHQIKTTSLITSIEEARDAITNGYALAVCSSQGFSNKRDDQGFARPKGSWSHGMAWMGVDDSSSRPGFLVCNSWGKWNSGPKRHDQPDGSFWIDYEVAASMISKRGSWAFSSFDGFPAKEVPNYLLGVFG